MQVLEKTLKEDTRREFAESFSLRNIKQLVRRHVHDFGGDFLRLDNDEFRWANIRILYDETMLNNEVILCFRNVEVEKREQLEQKQLLDCLLYTSQQAGNKEQHLPRQGEEAGHSHQPYGLKVGGNHNLPPDDEERRRTGPQGMDGKRQQIGMIREYAGQRFRRELKGKPAQRRDGLSLIHI